MHLVRNPFPAPQTPPLTIIGLGSPFGDDRVGWVVADELAAGIDDPRVRILALDRPGTALLDELAGRAEAILIDAAVISGLSPGTVQCLSLEGWLFDVQKPQSTHGLGLADTLELGKALGIMPPGLTLYLICVDPKETVLTDVPLTPPVEAAVRVLVDECSQRVPKLLCIGCC